MAFGKVILLGEHAVVYGHAALAGALARGVTATARRRAEGPSTLAVPAWKANATSEDATSLGRALRALVNGAGGGSYEVTADSAIPPGAGLGSSAALSVAVVQALAAANKNALTVDEIERLADAAERQFHTNPSGVDVALAVRGGLGLFRRGQGLVPLRARSIRLAISLPSEARSTAAMVERVAAAVVDPAQRARLDSLGDMALAGAEALERDDSSGLGPLLTRAHDALARIGVSTANLDRLVELALGAGALGAKLTGGGGGGAVIALAPGREDAVLEAWRGAGSDGFAAEVGARP